MPNGSGDGMAARDIAATIPRKANRKEPVWFDEGSCLRRPRVENACRDLKQFRGLACRYTGRVGPASWFRGTKGRQRRAAAYHKDTRSPESKVPTPGYY